MTTKVSALPHTRLPHIKLEPLERRWLLACMAAFACLYVVFYPPIYTSLDESSNFGMAYVLKHGTLFPERVGYHLPMSVPGPYGTVYRFPIGLPLTLACLSFFGWKAFFLLNPVMHLTATWLFAHTLKALGISARLAILYLLYPSLTLYSRTLFSDPFASSLTAVALYFLIARSRPDFAGVAMGVALLARSTSLLVALIFAVGLAAQDMQAGSSRRPLGFLALHYLLGLLPFIAVNMLYNHLTLGSPFKSTYSFSMLSVHGLRTLGPLYSLSLLLFYPGMLLAPLFYRGRIWRTMLMATTAALLIAASYHESTYGNNLLQTLISFPRQVLPVMPLYLLAYCALLARLSPVKKVFRSEAARCIAVVGLLTVCGGIMWQHQKYLRLLYSIRLELNRTLPRESVVYCNKDVFKLAQPVWDTRQYRDLLTLTPTQIQTDLRRRPVYVALYLRNRGVANEDNLQKTLLSTMQDSLALHDGPPSQTGLLRYYQVDGAKK